MSHTIRMLALAAQVSRLKDDDRTYFHGAVGVRNDGVMVCAANGNPKTPTPKVHCEARILRKLGHHGTIYLVRTLADGSWADSTPCIHCRNAMRAAKVAECVYTTGPNGWVARSLR